MKKIIVLLILVMVILLTSCTTCDKSNFCFDNDNDFYFWMGTVFLHDVLPINEDIVSLFEKIDKSEIDYPTASTYIHDDLIKLEAIKKEISQVQVKSESSKQILIKSNKILNYLELSLNNFKEGLENNDEDKLKLGISYTKRTTEEMNELSVFLKSLSS